MLHKIILIIHIIVGTSALTMGILPMVLKKGSWPHKLSGKIYCWSMYLVSLSTVFLFLLNTQNPFFQFLLCIAVLGFYLTFTGARAPSHRYSGSNVWDRSISLAILLIAVGMFIYGSWKLYIAITNHSSIFLGILYTAFGLALGSAARADFILFRNKNEREFWLKQHIIRMLSAYIATFTAFCVVNVHFLPPMVVWVLPGLIGGILIGFVVKKYSNGKQYNPIS